MATSTHFLAVELACHHGINGTTEGLVAGLEQLRSAVALRLGAETPIRVHDAYRCPRCNSRLVNSVKNSQHTLGRAADISVAGMRAWDLFLCALRVPAFAHGGIGRDDHQNYIHVDCRPYAARWCYDAQGRQIVWFTPANANS